MKKSSSRALTARRQWLAAVVAGQVLVRGRFRKRRP